MGRQEWIDQMENSVVGDYAKILRLEAKRAWYRPTGKDSKKDDLCNNSKADSERFISKGI